MEVTRRNLQRLRHSRRGPQASGTLSGSSSSTSPVPPIATAAAIDNAIVSVEVCLNPSNTARIEDVHKAVGRFDLDLLRCLRNENRNLSHADGPVPMPLDDTFLLENVKRISICNTDAWAANHKVLLFWQVKPVVHVFQLSEEGPEEDPSGVDMLSSFNEWALPVKEFDRMWESLWNWPQTAFTPLCC